MTCEHIVTRSAAHLLTCFTRPGQAHASPLTSSPAQRRCDSCVKRNRYAASNAPQPPSFFSPLSVEYTTPKTIRNPRPPIRVRRPSPFMRQREYCRLCPTQLSPTSLAPMLVRPIWMATEPRSLHAPRPPRGPSPPRIPTALSLSPLSRSPILLRLSHPLSPPRHVTPHRTSPLHLTQCISQLTSSAR